MKTCYSTPPCGGKQSKHLPNKITSASGQSGGCITSISGGDKLNLPLPRDLTKEEAVTNHNGKVPPAVVESAKTVRKEEARWRSPKSGTNWEKGQGCFISPASIHSR